MTEKEFLTNLKNVKKSYVKIGFMLGFYQCMRISEVVLLKQEDIDYERNYIHIRQSKGSKDRMVPIMQPVKRGLKHVPIGIGIRALQIQFKKYYPQFHFHTLRHSGASYYLNEKGIDIRYIQQLLGHSRLDTTQIYTHVTPQNLKIKFDDLW